MTFTLTIQDFSPSDDALEKLLDGCATVRVEFEAYPRVYWDPVETDWPPVIQRGVSVNCDMGNVVIGEVWADVECERCAGSEFWELDCCCATPGSVYAVATDIFSRLSAPDLIRLKEECAEYAMEHAVDYQAQY